VTEEKLIHMKWLEKGTEDTSSQKKRTYSKKP